MNKNELRKEYGYSPEDFILLYIAEFIPRKNHRFLLNAVPALWKSIPETKVLLPGKGILLKEMKILAVELEIDSIVRFPGYRKDINNLCCISDVHVSVSRQEGLAINNIEAMACGLPIIASDIRGHRDVVFPGRNGFLFPPDSSKDMIAFIKRIYDDNALRDEIGNNNIHDAEKFSVKSAVDKMAGIYSGL